MASFMVAMITIFIISFATFISNHVAGLRFPQLSNLLLGQSLTLKTFNLQQVGQSIFVFHEIAHKILNISEPLGL